MERKNGRITAYIHMDAIAQNFQNMRRNIGEKVQMAAVVKTDGYGHGAVPVARLAEELPYIWGYAVATVPEAMGLREAGLRKPILVLGYTFREDYPDMVEKGIRPAVFTRQMALEFSEEARRQHRRAPVHLAVDTGMSRIGFADTGEGLAEALEAGRMENLAVEGVFTHFAKADERDKGFTEGQIRRFTAFCSPLAASLPAPFLRHCSNSAGILDLPEANMDLVRAGIMIYGIYPSGEVGREAVRLTPAMELKSHIVYIKEIPTGTPVSYGGTFTADRPMAVATIPVGYGDGYPRSLSGRGYVLIHGRKAPILGRVCMDQFMVDVTGIPAALLDEVTLLGRDGGAEITVEELGRLSGRFPYEFVCDIGKRVPRVYL